VVANQTPVIAEPRRALSETVAFGVVLALGTFALGTAAVRWAPANARTAAWWPAGGLAVAVLIQVRQRRALLVGVVVLASLAANLVGGRPFDVAVGFSVSNGLEAAVACWFLCRRNPVPGLRDLGDVWRVAGAAALGAAVIATGAALTVITLQGGNFLTVFRLVAAAHGAAVLILAPLALQIDPPARSSRTELVLQWLATIGVMLVVFVPRGALPLTFVILPFAVWGALRLSLRSVSLQLAVIAVMVVVFTEANRGPFSATATANPMNNPNTASALAQALLVVLAFALLPLGVAVAQRRAALAEVSGREEMFRQGFSDSLLGMLLLRRVDGVLAIAELNDRAACMLGREQEDLVGSDWLAVIRQDMVDAEALSEVSGWSLGWHGEVRLELSGGTRWLEAAVSPLHSPANTDMFTVQLIDVTSRRTAQAVLESRASRDSLTGLANRSLLLDRLAESLDGGSIALMFLDVDDFKNINDSAGHGTGDRVLVELAQRLETVTRPNDTLARIGGDEFVVLCTEVPDPAAAEAIAGRLITAVGHSVVVDGSVYPVGVSIGIALGTPGCTVEDLMSNADTAMYASKAAGKHCTTVFAEAHRTRAVRAVRLQPELRRALAENLFVLHVQPIIDLETEAIVAAEALVRWQHPTDGLLGPDTWLDVAESSGLMPELGERLLRSACALATAWPHVPMTGQPVRVHVNVSARQLDTGSFGEMVASALADTGLPPDHLVIEFTETHLAHVRDELVDDLHALAATGVCLAADDYGTGYSPLTKITDLPLNMVKIDKQFVAGMLADQRSLAVVQALIGLGHALSLDVVAEGVESVAQADALRSLGCRTGQGFLWSRPMVPEQFQMLLDEKALVGVRSLG
jgi:diguanylate cyclase (GGDEF)-like protein/PAS domain S-box-containing protein